MNMRVGQISLAVGVALICACTAALADDAQAPEVQKVWTTSVSLGATLTDGNSETLQANGSVVVEGKKDRLGSVRLSLEGNYGNARTDGDRETTVGNAKAAVNGKKDLSARTFVAFDATALYDDIAQVDYRVTAGPGLGLYLIKGDRTTMSIEAGPSYVWERVSGTNDHYFAFRAAERFEVKLSDTAKLWQSAAYIPKADDFEDYLLTAELGVEAMINSHMSLRLVAQDKYDSYPADDLERNDVTLIGGLKLNL